jgi:hypothetical protein
MDHDASFGEAFLERERELDTRRPLAKDLLSLEYMPLGLLGQGLLRLGLLNVLALVPPTLFPS